uniref:protein phosphatase 1 regulatory subunit 14C n=1 Tax=Jaculus jaculus TaxID=51337 RepID=UPI001E1B2484|nr:protein phosphatase 1 regulatory subunit 14C [Jaculus jaculus]
MFGATRAGPQEKGGETPLHPRRPRGEWRKTRDPNLRRAAFTTLPRISGTPRLVPALPEERPGWRARARGAGAHGPLACARGGGCAGRSGPPQVRGHIALPGRGVAGDMSLVTGSSSSSSSSSEAAGGGAGGGGARVFFQSPRGGGGAAGGGSPAPSSGGGGGSGSSREDSAPPPPVVATAAAGQLQQRRHQQGKVTVKYDRKELRRRLVLEEWIVEQLGQLYDCEEEEMPDVEIDIDDLLDADSEEERALKLQEALVDCYKPTEEFIKELLSRIRGMRKLSPPQKKSV